MKSLIIAVTVLLAACGTVPQSQYNGPQHPLPHVQENVDGVHMPDDTATGIVITPDGRVFLIHEEPKQEPEQPARPVVEARA